MQANPSVFKAYDIRGIVGTTIDERFAEHLGRAFGSEAVRLGEKAVVVPNGVCLREAAGGDGKELRARYRPPIVGYLGAFEYFVDFDLVLTAARALREVTFLLVGAGRELAALALD